MKSCSECELPMYETTEVHKISTYSLAQIEHFHEAHKIPAHKRIQTYRIFGLPSPPDPEDLPLYLLED